MADVVIQITIKEKYQQDFLDAIERYNKLPMVLECPESGDYRMELTYDVDGMGPVARGRHVIVQLAKMFLEMYRREQDKEDRYDPAQAAIPKPTGKIDPDGIT